ncbi:hypothetical protein [Streptomyces sp. NPDC048272]|uniref:hypothetical protein n=1 Tax=Streptomyces sp. NPDC048272 TaxID=3154616 RepID=UPI0034387D3A
MDGIVLLKEDDKTLGLLNIGVCFPLLFVAAERLPGGAQHPRGGPATRRGRPGGAHPAHGASAHHPR